jgi:hypothetical protein
LGSPVAVRPGAKADIAVHSIPDRTICCIAFPERKSDVNGIGHPPLPRSIKRLGIAFREQRQPGLKYIYEDVDADSPSSI